LQRGNDQFCGEVAVLRNPANGNFWPFVADLEPCSSGVFLHRYIIYAAMRHACNMLARSIEKLIIEE
jgi:hypothetical protein